MKAGVIEISEKEIEGLKLSKTYFISHDSTKCTGCKVCELVCSFVHHHVFSESLARIHIFNDIFAGKNRAYVCQQCTSPQCYYACPNDAIHIDYILGKITFDSEKCDACGACAKACPFNEEGHVIKYDPDKNIFVRCELCGGNPMCVEWCVTKALSKSEFEGNPCTSRSGDR